MPNKHSRAGFTLIELMVTVAIVGVLAGVSITLFKGQQLRAKRSEAMTNVEAIVKMVRAYFGDVGQYPSVGGSWPASPPDPTVVMWDAASTTAFGTIGFRAEQAVRYRYDVDAGVECPCASGACFTVMAYSDLDGDKGVGAVGYFHRDTALIECPSTIFGWAAPSDPQTFIPIYDSVAAYPRLGGATNDDY